MLAEFVDANDRRPGLYTELAIDGGRGFTSPFPPPAKGTPDSEILPLPGIPTFWVLFLW
jgi:hypothetical protein